MTVRMMGQLLSLVKCFFLSFGRHKMFFNEMKIIGLNDTSHLKRICFQGWDRGDPEAAVGRREAEGRAAESEAPQGRGGQRQDEQDHGVCKTGIQFLSDSEKCRHFI